MNDLKKPENLVSKISNFFKKKSLESKFKNAGTGHKLCDDTRQPVLIKKPEYIPVERTEFTDCAYKAGEAAIIRDFEKKTRFQPKPKNYSASLDTTNELEKEKELQKAYEQRDRALGKSIEVEKPKQLAKVHFCCPSLFEFDIIGGYNEMEEKIFDYLKSEAGENPILAHCLIIHSKCKKGELLTSCLTIIETLLTNIIKSPAEVKYRKIRLANEKIKQNIVQVEGAIDFLKAVGFCLQEQLKPGSTDEMEPCLIIPEDACNPEKLAEYLENLKQAEPIRPIVYRDTNVYHKSNLASISEEDLSAEFFRISLDELKRLNAVRQQQIEESGMLLTKAMRANMNIRDKRKYRYVLIRVQFSNNWVLQGTFSANNQIKDIVAWITDCLKVNQPFFLSVPPIIRKITDFEQTIVDAEMAPCSTIRLTFDNISINECQDKDANSFLKDQLLC